MTLTIIKTLYVSDNIAPTYCWADHYYVKTVRIRSYSGPHFSRIFPHSNWIGRDTLLLRRAFNSETVRTETMATVQLILLNPFRPNWQSSVSSTFVWSTRARACVCDVPICVCVTLRWCSWRHVRKRIGKENFVFCFFNIHWIFVTLQQFHAILKFPNHNLM